MSPVAAPRPRCSGCNKPAVWKCFVGSTFVACCEECFPSHIRVHHGRAFPSRTKWLDPTRTPPTNEKILEQVRALENASVVEQDPKHSSAVPKTTGGPRPVRIPKPEEGEAPPVVWMAHTKSKFTIVTSSGNMDEMLAVCGDHKDAFRIEQMARACEKIPGGILEDNLVEKLLRFAVAVGPTLTVAQLRRIEAIAEMNPSETVGWISELVASLGALNTLDAIETIHGEGGDE